MNLTIAGKRFEITEIHTKADNSIRVMIEQDGRAIVSYEGNPKFYICNKSKARQMWARS